MGQPMYEIEIQLSFESNFDSQQLHFTAREWIGETHREKKQKKE